MWVLADVVGLFSVIVGSFSRNVGRHQRIFSAIVVPKRRMLSGPTIYVCGPLQIARLARNDTIRRERPNIWKYIEMLCNQGTICFEWMKGVPAAFVTLIIGAIATKITYNQFLVARAKLKLDLFDKRLVIFQKVWAILSEVVSTGTRGRNYGLSTPFNNFMPEAEFLFGPDIAAYLREATAKWIELSGYEFESEQSDSSSRAKNAVRVAELRGWFHDEASNVRNKFAPYLDFKNWQ
jgi:hypothetical protein